MRGKERIPKEEETQVTGEAAVGENYFVTVDPAASKPAINPSSC